MNENPLVVYGDGKFDDYDLGNHVIASVCTRCGSIVPRSHHWQEIHERDHVLKTQASQDASFAAGMMRPLA